MAQRGGATLAGLEFCERCAADGLLGRLEHRGWRLQLQVQRTRSLRFSLIHVQAETEAARIVRAHFRPTEFGDGVLEVLTRELKVDDAEFDDAVYISTSTKDTTRQVLQHPALLAAILAFIVDAPGQNKSIGIVDGKVDVRVSSDQPEIDRPTIERITCVLLHQLEAVASGTQT